MRPVIRARPCLEGPVTCPRFLLPFGCRRSLLGRPVPSRIYALLAVGLPAAGQFCRTWTGFPCSALVRYDRCRAPPVPRGRGAHVAGIETSAITAAFQRRALFSGASSIHPEFWVTRLAEVHLIRPSGLPLACNLRMDRRSLGFLPGFTPRRYQRRMPGAGTSVEHSLEANRRSFSTLHFGYLTHYSATSRRTSGSPGALLRRGPLRTVRATRRGTRLKQPAWAVRHHAWAGRGRAARGLVGVVRSRCGQGGRPSARC
jgi:hypothetical protein